MIYVYERSAVAEGDRQLLRDFQQKIPGSKMTASEIYQKQMPQFFVSMYYFVFKLRRINEIPLFRTPSMGS